MTPRVATACDDDVEIELRDVLGVSMSLYGAKPDARGFYVVTETAMYKLLRPKSTYAMLYDASFQMRYDLARRAARGLRRSPRATFDSVLGELLVRQPADATALQRATERDDDGETWTSYTERDVLACKETLCDMCLREMVHLRRRSAQFVAALTRKPSSTTRARREDEFVMCPHTDVVDVNEEDLMRIYGEPECATCADAPARRTIEMGLERADREEWAARVSASSTFGADASLIEEAITAWQFYATHTDLLNAPVVAFDAFMRALMSPPSQMSWALFATCTARSPRKSFRRRKSCATSSSKCDRTRTTRE